MFCDTKKRFARVEAFKKDAGGQPEMRWAACFPTSWWWQDLVYGFGGTNFASSSPKMVN